MTETRMSEPGVPVETPRVEHGTLHDSLQHGILTIPGTVRHSDFGLPSDFRLRISLRSVTPAGQVGTSSFVIPYGVFFPSFAGGVVFAFSDLVSDLPPDKPPESGLSFFAPSDLSLDEPPESDLSFLAPST